MAKSKAVKKTPKRKKSAKVASAMKGSKAVSRAWPMKIGG